MKNSKANDTYADAIREIITFSEDNPALSYYDIKAYAFDHDKEDWLDAMRNSRTREIIALMVRETHRKAGIPYMNSHSDSSNNLSYAEARYYERHDSTR